MFTSEIHLTGRGPDSLWFVQCHPEWFFGSWFCIHCVQTGPAERIHFCRQLHFESNCRWQWGWLWWWKTRWTWWKETHTQVKECSLTELSPSITQGVYWRWMVCCDRQKIVIKNEIRYFYGDRLPIWSMDECEWNVHSNQMEAKLAFFTVNFFSVFLLLLISAVRLGQSWIP